MKKEISEIMPMCQLVCLANLENLNAVFIGDRVEQSERLTKLNQIAISQMKILLQDNSTHQLYAK